MSMTVIIRETKEEKILSMIDYKTGISYEKDFISNAYGFANGDFKYDRDSDTYACNQEAYEWWAKVCAEHQDLDDRIDELKAIYGTAAVERVLEEVEENSLENHAAAVHAALDEAFGPQEQVRQ